MSRFPTNLSWAATDWRGPAFLSYQFCSQILTVVELLNLLNIGIQHLPMNFVPKSYLLDQNARVVVFFFHRSTDSGF
jgi:hypothetical protein